MDEKFTCTRIDECPKSANPCGAASVAALFKGELLPRCDRYMVAFATKPGHTCVCKRHYVLAPSAMQQYIDAAGKPDDCRTDNNTQCDTYVCKPIDYCASNSCGSKYATCTNTPAAAASRGYTCGCQDTSTEYEYNNASFTCPCPCGARATCKDLDAAATRFDCRCNSGYHDLDAASKFDDCLNIDESNQTKHPQGTPRSKAAVWHEC